jgi:hypothetical protein
MLSPYYKSIRRHNEKPQTKEKIVVLNWFEKFLVFIKSLFKAFQTAKSQ